MESKEFVRDVIDSIKGTVANQNMWRKRQCLNMIAAENVTSPLLDSLVVSDFSHRYAEGWAGHRHYRGNQYTDEIEELAMELFKKLFDARHVDLRPISGTVANFAGFGSLAKRGDSMLCLSIPCGGHVSHTEHGAAGYMGLDSTSLPFDSYEMNIDVGATEELIRQLKPKFILFGGSLFLFPHPVRELKPVCDELGIKMMYDGAHVLGLIAGKQFQQPLKEGADLFSASTHKTFPGPQGGMLMTNSDQLFEKVKWKVFPKMVCNHHLHRLPCLAVAALEMLEFGEAYAKQTVSNAQALAQALHELGFHVLAEHKGFTQSHQVVVDVTELGRGPVDEKMEKANIIMNRNLLPRDASADMSSVDNPSGIRLGVQELTRWGMKESDMLEVAQFFKRVLVDSEEPTKVRDDVIELRSGFQKVHYCFDVDE